MKYNHAMLCRLFEPLSPALAKAVAAQLDRAVEPTATHGSYSSIRMFGDGRIELKPEATLTAMPRPTAYLEIIWYTGAKSEMYDDHVSCLRIILPVSLLRETPKKYFIYNVGFKSVLEIGAAADNPLSNGYYGITKRNPFVRFREHQRDAATGVGHILHKTWHGLVKRKMRRTVRFFVADQYDTLDEAYAAEERRVDEFTLAPKGLNAIPGGMKGIRMMHQLRLLHGTRQVSVDDRDAALVRLEQAHDRNSPCAHYRTGHFRTLPTGNMTWVSPCWVNPTPLG